ncbi:PREDICTED: endochitinase At2g43590-like [Camelina sativa]|uniref:Endochitinase At2g43590-like n=1 Tax=Camelina sativa TaxID=90675 RepID=A0ABM1R7N6_CAMSA|nr:PREDICTED: endochitinase At2g43590-like [Camelina sativa]
MSKLTIHLPLFILIHKRKKKKKGMALKKISSVFLIFIFGFYSETAKSQYCGCSPILCCSKFGYCGVTEDYCGSGCISGPCRNISEPVEPVDSIVTQKFFNGIISQASNGCAGKKIYTRDSFLKAAHTNLEFSMSVTRREIAAMFAHFTYETQHFCNIEEVNGSSYDYCDENDMQYPCAHGKKYYGRGPMQLSWNYNYGSCGQSLGLDLLREPELVGSNPTVAFRTSMWFWMNSVRPVLNQGFGATIKAINNNLEWRDGN